MRSVCFFGDDFTLGVGDSSYGGWAARLCTSEIKNNYCFRYHNLAIAGDTSYKLMKRWYNESLARKDEKEDNLIVFCFGQSDMSLDKDGQPLVSLPECLEYSENIIKTAAREFSVLWISPIPSLSMFTGSGSAYNLRARNERLSCLNALFYDTAKTLGVSYLNLFDNLSENPDWQQALSEGGGVLPSISGHRLFAEKVKSCKAWRRWVECYEVKTVSRPIKKVIFPVPFTPPAF